eukprot:g8839.t1
MKFRLISFQHVSKDIQPEKDYLHVQDGFSIRDLIKRVALLLSLKTRNNDAHFTLDSTGAKIINIAQILGMRSGETITYCDKGMCKLKFINDTETLPTFVFLVYASSHTGNAPVTLKLRQNISWGMFINLVLKKLQLTETTSGARFTLLADQLKCNRIEDIAKLAGGTKVGKMIHISVSKTDCYRRKINSQGCIHMYYKLIQPVLDHFKKLKSLEIVQGLGVTSADDSKGDTIDSHAYSYIRKPELSVPESQHVTRRLSSINETYPLTHMDPGLGGYLNAADKQRTAIVDRSDKQGIDLSPIMDGESLQESTSYLEETGGEFSGELSESFLQPLTFN